MLSDSRAVLRSQISGGLPRASLFSSILLETDSTTAHPVHQILKVPKKAQLTQGWK